MKLRHALLTLCLCASLAGQGHAGVKENMVAGMPLNFVIQSGLATGESIEDIIRQAIEAAPFQRQAIVASALVSVPDLTGRIVKAAIVFGVPADAVVGQAIRVAPTKVSEIVGSALQVAPSKSGTIARAAIASGINPNEIIPIINAHITNENSLRAAVGLGGNDTAGVESNGVTRRVGQQSEATTDGDFAPTPVIVIPPSRGGDAAVASAN